MRILFVINCFAMAGAEKLVFDLSRRIRQECDYVGIAALYDRQDAVEQSMTQELTEAGVEPIILHKRAKQDRLQTVMMLRRVIRERKVDLVHAHCSVPMLLGKLAGFGIGVPVVCTIHNTRGYSCVRERLTGWLAAEYISIGKAAESYMTDSLHIPQQKIRRIYNAVDTEQFRETGRIDAFWENQGIPADSPVVVNVGRFTEVKNQICLLRAIKSCKDRGIRICCVFLGDYTAQGSTYPQLMDYVKENGLENQAVFLGVKQNVCEYLNHADCFVMTSVFEGLSVAFLEAVFCGVPIVTTELPFVRELNEIAPCAAVVPQNGSEALAELLAEQRYKKPSKTALEAFRALFSMERYTREHLQLYRELIAEKREIAND